MAPHNPRTKPTPKKVLKGFKQFEEGLVIYEALSRNGPTPLPMDDMWIAHALYRQVADAAQQELDAKREEQ